MAAEARAGGGKRADAAAAVLVQACRMGLPQQAARLLEHTAARIAEDSAVDSLITTAEQLLLLHISREPLETGQLPGLPETAAAAYERACYLLADLGATPPEGEAAALAALNAMTPVALALGDALGGARAAALAEIRRTGLRALLAGEGSAALRGGAAGALYADGAVDGADLVPLVAGHLDLHGPAFLRGLLATARACLWQVPALHAAVTTRLAAWPDADFLRLLPDLRLAFSALTASECDRLARAVAGSVGAALLPPLRVAGASEADLLLGATLDARVRALLEQDGLAGWLAPESPVAARTLPPLDRPAGEAP